MIKVFTTGQVAKICKVAPRTVSKWFDSGRLKGYRIPGSQDRRIPRAYLMNFLREYGMTSLMDITILVVSTDNIFVNQIMEEFKYHEHVKVVSADNGFDAGMKIQSAFPSYIIIDISSGEADSLIKSVTHQKECSVSNVILVGADPSEKISSASFLGVFSNKTSINDIIRVIRKEEPVAV